MQRCQTCGGLIFGRRKGTDFCSTICETDPSPEQIQQRAAKIRRSWDHGTLQLRIVGFGRAGDLSPHVETPIVSNPADHVELYL